MALETSQDVLYIVLALCIVWFTVFLCWLLYQAARVLRNANRIIENVTAKLELITDAVEFIRRKVDGLSSSLGAVSGMLSGLVEKFIVSKISRSLGGRFEKTQPRTGNKKKAAK